MRLSCCLTESTSRPFHHASQLSNIRAGDSVRPNASALIEDGSSSKNLFHDSRFLWRYSKVSGSAVTVAAKRSEITAVVGVVRAVENSLRRFLRSRRSSATATNLL